MPRPCLDAILLAVLPAVQAYRKKKCVKEFFITLVFEILLFTLAIAIIYCAHAVEGLELVVAIFCVFIPALGLYLATKKCDKDVLICFVLTCFGLLPGVVYAFHKA